MASGPITSWQTDGETVRDFILGGFKITADGDWSHEIKRSLILRRKVMTNLDGILKSRDITLSTKVCLVKAMVFPVVMYACESWIIKKAEHRRIDVFELWCWKRLLRVPWTARRSNQSILKEISPEYLLEGLMLKLKLQYFGHLMRRTDSLEKTLMLGNSMDISLSKLWELVMNREAWHAAVHGAEVQLNWGHKSKVLTPTALVPLREEEGLPESSLFLPLKIYRGKTIWGYSEMATICKLEREPSPETNLANILILDFKPPELW